MLGISDINIKAFRGLRGAILKDCKPFNLIVGANNSGKSSVLEAILLQDQPLSLDRWRSVASLRNFGGREQLSELKGLFPLHVEDDLTGIKIVRDGTSFDAVASDIQGDPFESYSKISERVPAFSLPPRRAPGEEAQEEDLIEGLEVCVSGSAKETLFFWERGRTHQGPQENVSCIFNVPWRQPVIWRLSSVIRDGRKDQLLELLRTIDPALTDIFILAEEGSRDAKIFVRHHRHGAIPLGLQGRGLSQALSLALSFANLNSGGILLIDEFETGMHTSILGDVMKWLTTTAREHGIQIFATTHSLETVDGILAALDNDIDDLGFYRTRDGEVYSRDEESLRTARELLGHEVR